MFQTKAASEIEFTNLNELHAWVVVEIKAGLFAVINPLTWLMERG